jgi:hypothetical protein
MTRNDAGKSAEIINFRTAVRERSTRRMMEVLNRMAFDVDLVAKGIVGMSGTLARAMLMPEAQVDLLMFAQKAQVLSGQIEAVRRELMLPEPNLDAIHGVLSKLMAQVVEVEGDTARVLGQLTSLAP